MSFFEDMEKSLLEAIEMEKGNIPVKERKGMAAPTFYVSDDDTILIDKVINIRKSENISQSELAEKTGSTQQAISRFENKMHNSSLKLFVSIVNALGYEIQFVKKKEAR